MYTNFWDPDNGTILISTDQGKTFTTSSLPFKVGGNMPGRGVGEVRGPLYVAISIPHRYIGSEASG
jgi:hypothetical protein